MKLHRFFGYMLLAGVLALFAASCGSDDDDDSEPAPTTEAESAPTTAAPAPTTAAPAPTTAAEPAPTTAAPAPTTAAPAPAPEPAARLRIAIVAPSATNDLAFSQSIYDGVEALDEEREIEVAITDGTFIVEEAAAQIRAYADDGYDLVIAHGSQYGGSLQEIAPDYPDTTFAWGTALDTFGLDNVYAYTAASDQGGYVLGTMAAELTETNAIGVVGPIEVGDAKLFVDGFKSGAEAQNSNVNVNVVYIGSFSDVALATETAEAHVAQGADVMTGSAQMVVGAVGVADREGVLWFGTQADQRSLAPDIVVASQVYKWEVILRQIVADMDSGASGGKAFTITFENDGLEIAYNDGYSLPASVRQLAEDTIAGIKDGSISTGA